MVLNELRIGNWIDSSMCGHASTFSKIGMVSQEGWIGLQQEGTLSMNGTSKNFISPIPLTEEWLVKFGFVYTMDYDEYRYKEKTHWFNIQFDEIDGERIYIFGKDNMSDVKIEYVHQLQNLYFALAGEELEQKS